VKRQVSLKGSCSCREDTRYYLSLKMLLSFKVIRIYIVDWSVYNTISYSYSFVRVKNYVTCIVSSRYSTSNNGVSLNSGLGSHSMSLEMALYSTDCMWVPTSYSFSTAMTALSCIVFEVKRDNGQKLWFLHIPFSITIKLKHPEENSCEYFLAVFFHNRVGFLPY